MSMTTAAYLRVSTGQQSIDQQHDAIAAAGITPDRVFTDTARIYPVPLGLSRLGSPGSAATPGVS